MSAAPLPDDIAAVLGLPPGASIADIVLAISGERERWQARADAAWREGHHAGHRAGLDAGRRDMDAEYTRAWRINAGLIIAQIDPDSSQARALAAKRVRAAEAGCRRDAREHWRSYWRRMHALARDPRYVASARALPAYEGSGGRSHEQVIVLLIVDGLLYPVVGEAA